MKNPRATFSFELEILRGTESVDGNYFPLPKPNKKKFKELLKVMERKLKDLGSLPIQNGKIQLWSAKISKIDYKTKD